MFDPAHDWRLVLASLAVAMMAGFTGLSLLRGASALPPGRRKVAVSMAAVALGGGIWSMHFVAMLGLQLPILFYYDLLTTLISALVAILIVGMALLLLHFLPRSPATITGAGVLIGIGIPVMHYIGMSGMELCRPVYTVAGVLAAFAASILLSVGAVRLAYGARTRRGILLGTAGFGLAVFAMHFLAMAGTRFLQAPDALAAGPVMDNGSLAILVTLAAFVISAAFLLTGVTFARADAPDRAAAPPAYPTLSSDVRIPVRDPDPPAPVVSALPAVQAAGPLPDAPVQRIPYEREGRILFLDGGTVAALRAEGHYTILHHGAERLFCPWSISEAERRLVPAGFLRVHRSYLVNPRLVSGFERRKDSGLLFFEAAGAQTRVPVSRSHLAGLREALGL